MTEPHADPPFPYPETAPAFAVLDFQVGKSAFPTDDGVETVMILRLWTKVIDGGPVPEGAGQWAVFSLVFPTFGAIDLVAALADGTAQVDGNVSVDVRFVERDDAT